jgi:hypothetical protein
VCVMKTLAPPTHSDTTITSTYIVAFTRIPLW